MQIAVRSQTAAETTLSWQPVAGAARYRILWSDRPGETVRFKTAGESGKAFSPSAARRISPITSRCRRWQKTGPC